MAASARKYDVLADGLACQVRAVVVGSRSPVEPFLLREISKKERLASFALFATMADNGVVPPVKFKTEMQGLHAFRLDVVNRMLRYPCFQDGENWVITHGFVKSGTNFGRWPESEIDRAVRYRALYLKKG